MKARARKKERGVTLMELLVAMGIFLVISAAMFALLQMSQQRYASESQVSGSFQEARLAMDQIVRDVDSSGYPALALFPVVPSDSSVYAVAPLAWPVPGYPNTPCTIGTGGGGTCNPSPGDFDLIVETNVGSGVSWIRYQLKGTTLYRAVVPKTKNGDPVKATSDPGAMVPFLENVMNNGSAAQIAAITATYPTMFPGGVPQPVFQYTCDTPSGPMPCPAAGASGTPMNVRDVDVTLIVKALQPDQQSQAVRVVELNGRGHRVNAVN